MTPDGRTWVLLSHRSPHVQAGGTWSTFGGAIDAGETPWHAAVRETSEEIEGINIRPDALAAGLEAPCEHGCGWSYTTFAVRVQGTGADDLPHVRVAPGRAAWETAGLAWVPVGRLAAHPGLHPGLRAAWPALRRLIRGRTGPGECPGRSLAFQRPVSPGRDDQESAERPWFTFSVRSPEPGSLDAARLPAAGRGHCRVCAVSGDGCSALALHPEELQKRHGELVRCLLGLVVPGVDGPAAQCDRGRTLGRRFGGVGRGSHAVMTGDAPAMGGAGRVGVANGAQDRPAVGEATGNEGVEDRIARGSGVQEQIDRGADVREQDRLNAPGPGVAGTQEQTRALPERGGGSPERSRVPGWLQTGAGWSWRLLIIAAGIYLVARVLGILSIVVVPCIVALLLTALLQPLTARLRRAGLPALAATWVTLLIVAVVFGGLIMLIAARVSAEYPALVAETQHTITQIESLLAGPPFHLKSNSVHKFLNNVPGYLGKHKSLVEGTVLTGGKIASELFGGLVLMLFVLFFLIKDGERIWDWLLGAMRTGTARRWDRAGHAAWLALVYYMRGTVAVAAIHAIVVGVALSVMGVPLALALALLVFLAAFVPLVGLLVAGALAILVTLATNGWVDAVILLGVLIIEDQLEAHLLQPQVVGRVIRLHPLAVILALAVGAVLAGVPGAVVAVPVVAVITRALPELRRREPGDLGPEDP